MKHELKNLIRAGLRSDFSYTCCDDDCILSLPTTDEQLRAIRDRLGVKSFDECELMWVDSPLRALAKLNYNGDITLMNDIARAAAKAVEQDGGDSLLLAVLEAYDNEAPCELKERIEHLDCYELLPKELCTEERYGEHYFFQSPSANRVGDEMLPYIDFEKYGMVMMEKNDVKTTATGWLAPKIGSLKMYVPLIGKIKGSYYGTELNAHRLSLFSREIADRLDFDVKKYLPPSGLIADSKQPDAIKNKVLSVIPSVEIRNDELWGCLQITKQGWITEKELSALSGEWYNQLKFGWGDHFRTQDIRSGDYRFFSEKEMTEQQTGWLDDPSQTGGMQL